MVKLSADQLRISKETGQEKSQKRDFPFLSVGQEHLLNLSYFELEQKNFEVRALRLEGKTSEDVREEFLSYLEKEKGIKAVTVFFSDLEGRFHALDYNKKFLLNAEDNLTFDGSSIHGFTIQKESDLRLKIDWTTFRWAPADLFGPGKVLVFANVMDKDGTRYEGDFRGKLDTYCSKLRTEQGITVNVATEIEGFLFKGVKAEQTYDEQARFELATMSGYFNSLPQENLHLFIDKLAEVQRVLAFDNEKDHPEVAPSQFELNFRYAPALDAADEVQLYKLLARQVANSMGCTASFLPKPVAGVNGSGMHTNISLSQNGKNIFYDAKGKEKLSETAHRFITGILYYANDLCLVIAPSVNAYRRLDPHYEAPNEIKVSPTDRGSMIRIPIGNEKSARIEVRTVAPDVNPYLTVYALLKAGMAAVHATPKELKTMEAEVYEGDVKKLPGEIYTAMANFMGSDFTKEMMGSTNHSKYLSLKEAVADRSPRQLGRHIKSGEILYHHEVTNQYLWKQF
jgi:glutamine synthetase